MIYADPSFLFSFYCLDGNSPVAARTYTADARRPLLLTPWQRYELRNTVRLSARRSKPVPVQVGNVFKTIQEDLDAGRLRYADVDWRDSLKLAEELSDKHTQNSGAGATDVWHVAAAILLQADTFWTFDAEQRDVAVACGKFKRVPKL